MCVWVGVCVCGWGGLSSLVVWSGISGGKCGTVDLIQSL